MNTKKPLRRLNPNLDRNKKFISQRLNKLCKYLNDEYSINYGGCCLVAYLVADLLKRDNFKFKVLIWSDIEIPDDFKSIKYSQNHYAISLGRYNINVGDCSKDKSLHRHVYLDIKPKELLAHYKHNRWNDCYNIKHNNLISKMLRMSYAEFTEGLREE